MGSRAVRDEAPVSWNLLKIAIDLFRRNADRPFDFNIRFRPRFFGARVEKCDRLTAIDPRLHFLHCDASRFRQRLLDEIFGTRLSHGQSPAFHGARKSPVAIIFTPVYGPLKVFTGRSHPSLAQEICCLLEIEPGRVSLYSFSDGENYVQIDENVRGADVFVIQPTAPPVNDNLMELLIMLDAFKRSSARRITAVLPYYGYARQDRKDKPRVPITSKLVADLISAAGADRVLTLDLHASQIQGFFNIPVDHLFAAPFT